MDRDRHLLREWGIALAVMATIGAIVAGMFWAVTGVSPWPYVIVAEIGAGGWGTAMLALTSPGRRA